MRSQRERSGRAPTRSQIGVAIAATILMVLLVSCPSSPQDPTAGPTTPNVPTTASPTVATPTPAVETHAATVIGVSEPDLFRARLDTGGARRIRLIGVETPTAGQRWRTA